MNEIIVERKKAPAFLTVIGCVFLSVFSSSFVWPMIRLLINLGLQPAWIASLRMAALLLLLWPAVAFNKGLRKDVAHVKKKELLWMVLSGLFLAGHFFTLAFSIGHITIFGSSAIVSTQYLFTVAIAFAFLREKPGKGVVLGSILSIAGVVIISWSDFNLNGDITGNIYAVLSALFSAAYYVTGRHVRKSVSIGAYTVWVSTFAAFILAGAAFIVSEPFRAFDMENIALFFGLALFGSLGGHIGINWALKYVKADVTSMIILAAPLFSAIMGYLFFEESIKTTVLIGALMILTGIAFYIWIQQKERKKLVNP